MIEPINYLINRPSTGKNPVSTFISSISDQQDSSQLKQGQSELFFFHTHPPIIGQAIASLRRLQLLQSTTRCCRHSVADEGTENCRLEKQGLENDYYNVDSLSHWLANDWLTDDCSCSRCGRGNDDSAACYGSAYSALYDEVYQERPLVRLAEDKELDLRTGDSQFNRSSGNGVAVVGMNEFENCEGDDDDDDDNVKMDAHYDQVPDEFHHHCHHSNHQGYKDHNQDQQHGHQDNEVFHHHHHHRREEFREHPYQNLKKSNINSEARKSNTSASLYSAFSTFEGICQPSKTTFSSPSLAPLSSSFYYSPGHYSNPVDRSSTEEIKVEDFCSKRRHLRDRVRQTARFSFNSESTGGAEHRFDDSLDEGQGQFTQVTSPDCGFPTTATYRIKNATVARLVPIDRVIAEDVDEAIESNGNINTRDEPISRWSGTKTDNSNCFNYGTDKTNGSTNESEASFSCPWTLRMDQGIWADSINNHEGQNIFEDECGDYASLSKPLRETIVKPMELRKNYPKNAILSDTEEGEQQKDVILSESSKFLNAFGFLLSQDPSGLNSQLFLRDLVSGMEMSPPNSESVSCLSLSPDSDEKAESLFESSSACLTDALGRSMDESSLSSFFVFETSGQGLQSNSATIRKDDEGPEYTALLNRNVNSKALKLNPEELINRGSDKTSESGRTNMTKSSIKARESHLRPRLSGHQRAPEKDRQRRESRDFGSTDVNSTRFNHNSNLTSQTALGTSATSMAAPAQNGSPGKSSISSSLLNSLPSPVLRKVNIFPNSKIPGSPNISNRTKNSTPNHATPSSTPNPLHQSVSVPFRNFPAPNRQSSRNSLPPLNQIRAPNCKPVGPGKAGGFCRLNSKPLGSTVGTQSIDIGQSAKTSPKSAPKNERSSIFKFSSPKTKRSSVTLTLHSNSEEVDHVIPPGATGKKSGICKTV